jgi:hypothetical protein
MIGLLWKYGLGAALLAGVFALHLVDKNQGINDAVVLVRSEYIAAALAASEVTREREIELVSLTDKVTKDLHVQKKRTAAVVASTAGKLRGLQTALDSAIAASQDTPSPTRTDDPRGEIISQCGVAIATLDEYAQGLADRAIGLQSYIGDVCQARQSP